MGGKKHTGRPGKNPTADQAKLKEMLDQLSAPAEQLKHTIVELQVINDQLHKTNKSLTRTLNLMMGEFNERLSGLETAQFGEVKGDFEKYLTPKEDEDVQLSEVREDDGSASANAETAKEADDGGPSDESVETGDPEGDSTLH